MASASTQDFGAAAVPSWRGWMHTVAFMLSIPGVVILLLRASGAVAYVAASIYGAGLLLGFGTSAAYHRLAQSDRARTIMQRMDHSTIFVLIAGSCTPVALLGLPSAWGIPLISVVGAGAVLGVVLKQVAFDRLRWLEYALYPILGWAVVATSPALVRSMPLAALILLALGGMFYTVGIPVLVRERPNPWPRTFGYHEVWHTATVLGGACHFATMAMLIR